MGRWDLSVKILAWESPQDIVTLVMPGARYIRRREAQFQTQALPERPLPMREIRSDGVLEVEIAGQRFLIVVEVQSTKDEEMGERLLDYSYEAKRLHGLPVAAWVLYLLHVFEPPPSPLEWPVPGLGMVLTFQYGSIELAGMPLEELEQKELVGLAPLLLLTKGGAKREVIERPIPQLEAAHKPEGLAILQLIASFVFEKDPVELACFAQSGKRED